MNADLDHAYTSALRLAAAIRGGVTTNYGAHWQESSEALAEVEQVVDWLRSLYQRNSLRVPLVID